MTHLLVKGYPSQIKPFIRRIANYPIPHYSRWGLYPQAIFIIGCIVCFRWFPLVPGVAIGLLALAAAVMAVRADNFKRAEKGIWVAICLILCSVELRTVYKDRDEHDAQQVEANRRQNEKFEGIVDGLKEAMDRSDRNFAATMTRSDRILTGVSDDMKTQTGGDSFAYITFTPEPGYVTFETRGAVCRQLSSRPVGIGQKFLVSITSRGKFPLREIHATMMDDELRLPSIEEYTKHPESDWLKAIQSGDTEYGCFYLKPQSQEGPTGDVQSLGIYPLPRGESNRLSIAFSSLNGDWNEVLHLGRVNGTWHQCLSVMGPTVKQANHPFIYCDSKWPEGRGLADRDWGRPNPSSTR